MRFRLFNDYVTCCIIYPHTYCILSNTLLDTNGWWIVIDICTLNIYQGSASFINFNFWKKCLWILATVFVSGKPVEDWIINYQQGKKCPGIKNPTWIFSLMWRLFAYWAILEKSSVSIIHLYFFGRFVAQVGKFCFQLFAYFPCNFHSLINYLLFWVF